MVHSVLSHWCSQRAQQGFDPKDLPEKNILDLTSKLFSSMVCLITFGTKVFVSLLLFSFYFIFFSI